MMRTNLSVCKEGRKHESGHGRKPSSNVTSTGLDVIFKAAKVDTMMFV